MLSVAKPDTALQRGRGEQWGQKEVRFCQLWLFAFARTATEPPNHGPASLRGFAFGHLSGIELFSEHSFFVK